MQAKFKVKQGNSEAVEVTTGIADVIALEEKFGVAAAELGNGTKVTWLAFLAWHALKRKGQTTMSFEKWVEDIEQLESDDSGNE